MRKSAIILLAILIASCKGGSELDYQTIISERDALADELMTIQLKYDALVREKMNIELLLISLNEENTLLKKNLEVQKQEAARLVAKAAKERAEDAIPQSYKTKYGDTLWSISRRFKVPVPTLQKLNNLHGSNIVPGQQILLH